MTKAIAKKNKLIREMFDDNIKLQEHVKASTPYTSMLRHVTDFIVTVDRAFRKVFKIRIR